MHRRSIKILFVDILITCGLIGITTALVKWQLVYQRCSVTDSRLDQKLIKINQTRCFCVRARARCYVGEKVHLKRFSETV